MVVVVVLLVLLLLLLRKKPGFNLAAHGAVGGGDLLDDLSPLATPGLVVEGVVPATVVVMVVVAEQEGQLARVREEEMLQHDSHRCKTAKLPGHMKDISDGSQGFAPLSLFFLAVQLIITQYAYACTILIGCCDGGFGEHLFFEKSG